MAKNVAVEESVVESDEKESAAIRELTLGDKTYHMVAKADESFIGMSIGLFYALRKPVALDPKTKQPKGGAQADESLRKLANSIEALNIGGANFYNVAHIEALKNAYVEYRETHKAVVRFSHLGYKTLDVKLVLESNGMALPEKPIKGAYELFSWAIGKYTLSPDAFESACKAVYAERKAIADETHARLLTAAKL